MALRQLEGHRELLAGVCVKRLAGRKPYHRREFVAGWRQQGIVPHARSKAVDKPSGSVGRTTTQPGDRVRHLIRNQVAKIVGWTMPVGGLHRS